MLAKLALTLLFIVLPVYAHAFKVDIKISNVHDLPDSTAQFFIYTDNGALLPSLQRHELGPDDKNRYEQFEAQIDDVTFASDSHRGFYYADILSADGSTILKRVPLTYFDNRSISDTNWLIAHVQAADNVDDQFKGYPTQEAERGLISNENTDFLLLCFQTLINKGFVKNNAHWERIYGIFKANVVFFVNGAPNNMARVLTFVESHYDSNKQSAEFIEFYLEILSRMLTLDIGGRPAPGGVNDLTSYGISRIGTVFSNSPADAMEGASRALLLLIEHNEIDQCFKLSSAFLKSLKLRPQAIKYIKKNSQLERELKRLLKRAIDCSQIKYVLGDSKASRGDLRGGVEFLHRNPEGEQFLDNFYNVFNSAEHLFPRRNQYGSWRQVYEYYDLSSGLFAVHTEED